MTRRPQKPAVAQRATSSPRLQSDHHCYTSEHTPPQTTNQSNTEFPRRPLHPNPRQNYSHILHQTKHNTSPAMDQAKEFLEMPREFVKDGRQFITRCSKRTSSLPVLSRSIAKDLEEKGEFPSAGRSVSRSRGRSQRVEHAPLPLPPTTHARIGPRT